MKVYVNEMSQDGGWPGHGGSATFKDRGLTLGGVEPCWPDRGEGEGSPWKPWGLSGQGGPVQGSEPQRAHWSPLARTDVGRIPSGCL